ncbi:unnamed protein product [Victoria cruziana]
MPFPGTLTFFPPHGRLFRSLLFSLLSPRRSQRGKREVGRRLLLSVSSWTAEGVGAFLSMVLRRGRSVSCKKLPSPRARPQGVAMSCVARRRRNAKIIFFPPSGCVRFY